MELDEALFSDVRNVLSKIRGALIEEAEETDDGVHLRLSDGRLIVFTGEFVVAICAKKRTLQ